MDVVTGGGLFEGRHTIGRQFVQVIDTTNEKACSREKQGIKASLSRRQKENSLERR